MTGNELKSMNLVQLTGRINVKRYNEQNKSLFIVLSVSVPKSALASKGPDDGWNRDYPAIVFNGEAADEANARYEEGDRISVLGHMDTRQRMAYEGSRMYREVWEPYIVPDMVFPAATRIDANAALFCGEIIRVYRNADEGKRFYMITLRLPGGERDARATFTYFDPRMELEPQVGERIFANGAIQTKREVSEEDGRRQTRYIMSVVSRNVVIQRDGEIPEKDDDGDDDLNI